MSSIYFNLNKQIDANRLLKQIQNLINKNNVSHNSILQISVINVTYDNNEIVPKLEYKGEDNERQI